MANERDIEISEISVIMGKQSGRNVISRILEQSGVFTDTFNSDTHEHAKNAGRRQIGLWLINELEEAAPGEYLTLLRERQDG